MRVWFRIQEHGNWQKFTNKPGFLPKKAFVPSYMYVFVPFTQLKYIFHVKFQIYVTLKSYQDQDPHWLGSLDPRPDVD
jgi:hypothetical protein